MDSWRPGAQEGQEDFGTVAVWVQEKAGSTPVQYILPEGSTITDLIAEIDHRNPSFHLNFTISSNNSVLPSDLTLQSSEDLLTVTEPSSPDPRPWHGFHHVKLVPTTPVWRVVRKGMFLQGKCENGECSAYSQWVYVNRGFGTFSIERELQTGKCPVCSQRVGRATAIGVYSSKYRVEGMTRSEQDYTVAGETRPGMMAVFRDKDKAEWGFLVLDVSELA